MKLWHCVAQYDFYVLAESSEGAHTIASTIIEENVERPCEQVVLEPRRKTDIVAKWAEQTPYVGDDVVGYTPKVEDTCAVLFDRLYVAKPSTVAK